MTAQHASYGRFDPLGWLAMTGSRHHHHHRRHGRGGFPFGGPGFGFGGPFRRGPRARRGDVRAALLALLAEEPRNGYQLMQEIERRTEGVWRPSPGSVYPALQQLQDEGLVRSEERDGGRFFHLTDAGREAAEAQEAPWDSVSESVDADVWELLGVAKQVGVAIVQLAQAGTPEQHAAAREVLNNTRRALYGILADDAPPDE